MDRAELSRRLGAAARVAEPHDCVVREREPQRFMTAFTAAVAEGGTVFLADPSWGEHERAQFADLVRTPSAPRLGSETRSPAAEIGWLCIPTGGSSGVLRLARHDEQTIATAVHGFTTHFGVRRVNAVGLLPLHHVSGLMAWMRCALSGGTYLPWSWKELVAGHRPAIGTGEWCLSLVPTQLQHLLAEASAVEWLRRFRAVFIGGGPAWPELIDRAAEARLPLAFSYGMTETAAMITALRPEEFLAGVRGNGRPLPHARVSIGADERIEVQSASLFRGYWPSWRESDIWQTDDLGAFDVGGNLQVHGRRDAIIISGGEKIEPSEVENVLRATGAFVDVVVVGVPDPQWGQVVVACYPASGSELDRVAVEQALNQRLAKFKWPKRYVPIDSWPRTTLGKLNRAELLKQL